MSPQRPQVNTGERGDQGVGIITTLVWGGAGLSKLARGRNVVEAEGMEEKKNKEKREAGLSQSAQWAEAASDADRGNGL